LPLNYVKISWWIGEVVDNIQKSGQIGNQELNIG
jgi:hypothetical protein